MNTGKCKHGMTSINNNIVYVIGGIKSKNAIK